MVLAVAVNPGITYNSIEAAPGGALGIPITDVNNNCSTGSASLVHAAALVRAGDAHCALALGFERMAPGALSAKPTFPDRPSPMGPLLGVAERASPDSKRGPPMPRMFGAAATEYLYGGGVEHLAKIGEFCIRYFFFNHKQSLNNPYAQFRAGYDEAAVLASPQISNELTRFMCSPTSDGAACCILTNEAFAIELVATGLATDYLDAFAGRSAMDTVGYGVSRRLADKIFARAGMSRDDVEVVELHDCFAANEARKGQNSSKGKYVVNPSCGLEAKGHPLGTTGLAMHFSITKGVGAMQAPKLFDLPDARGKYGLVHNIGLGGAVVVSLLRRPEFYLADGPDGRDRLGYNHAHELRTITRADVDKVRTKSHSEGLLQLAKL
ncbi:thiolase-like protein [Lactarius pseudohatsudake]|nr:thiolase-like protein [Lactarius pseudohatsudake]